MTHIHKSLEKKWIAKRTVAMFLVVALLCISTISVLAFAATDINPKQEVVYINLNSDGKVDNVYVVNIFELSEDGKIIDYGNYTALRNMTTNDEIVFNNETITIDAKAGKLYYEGILDSNIIPWNFSIRYFLDGIEYKTNEIAGKSGALKIAMSVRENTACNSPFFDNYALQASFTLDTKLCENISTENATVANVGRKKQLTYTILPGKETDVVITADVTDFEMEGIAINGVPLSMNFDVNIGDSEELNELTNGASKLDDGATQLKGGAAELYDGNQKLIDGMRDLQSGSNELYDGANSLKFGTEDLQSGAKGLNDGASALLMGSNDLQKGSKELRIGAKDLNDNLGKLLQGGNALDKGIADVRAGALTLQNGAADLKGGVRDVRDGVRGVSNGLQVLSSQNDALLDGAYTVFQQLTKQAEMQLNQNLTAMGFPTVTLTPENYNDVLNGLLAALGGGSPIPAPPSAPEMPSAPEEMSEVSVETMTLATASNANYHVVNMNAVTSGTAILALQSQLNDYNNFYRGLQGYTNGVQSAASGSLSLVDGTDRLLSGVTNLQKGAKGLYDGLVVLKQGSTELVDGIKALQNGSAKLFDGTLVLENGTVQLYNGVVELSDGTKVLMEGANELYDGTVTLSDGTVELKNGVAELLNGLIELQNGVITLHDGIIELSDGTFELRDRTSDLDITIKDKIISTIDDMMGAGFEPVSFVSDKNTNVEFVQFVVKTDGIFKLETEAAIEVQNEPLTFWQKLLKLFGWE